MGSFMAPLKELRHIATFYLHFLHPEYNLLRYDALYRIETVVRYIASEAEH